MHAGTDAERPVLRKVSADLVFLSISARRCLVTCLCSLTFLCVGAQAVALRQLATLTPSDAGAQASLLDNPILANYRTLMASQRSFQINAIGNNSHYLDNVHTFTLQLLRYCEPDSMPWDHSDSLGVSWAVLKRSFTSSSSRPCRLNFVVDSRARAVLEQWLGHIFSISAFYTSNQTAALKAADIPGLEHCKLRRKVRPALLLPYSPSAAHGSILAKDLVPCI